jgi:threonine synthase
MDPHTAVAYAAWEKSRNIYPDQSGIILGTAHPLKFPDVVEQVTGAKIKIPESVAEIMKKEKKTRRISTDYQLFRRIILDLKN